MQYDGVYASVCPQYAEAACCSPQQRAALFLNFQLIQATFGGAGGAFAAALWTIVWGVLHGCRKAQFRVTALTTRRGMGALLQIVIECLLIVSRRAVSPPPPSAVRAFVSDCAFLSCIPILYDMTPSQLVTVVVLVCGVGGWSLSCRLPRLR